MELTNSELLEITKLAQDQLDWEIRINQLETDLEHAKEAMRQIQEKLLPDTMFALGMTEFKMLSGAKITIKDDVYASIRKDFHGDAINWLDNNGLGGIVKDEIKVNFGRGELEETKKLMEFCEKSGFMAEEKLSVHAQTLKATVKEQLAKGVEFPSEYFSVAPFQKAIIKLK